LQRFELSPVFVIKDQGWNKRDDVGLEHGRIINT
jgi:hypothetical protein